MLRRDSRVLLHPLAVLLICSASFGHAIQAQERQVKDSGNDPAMAELPIAIINSQGQPIAGVKVIPWALGDGQGHGIWGPTEGKPDVSGAEPKPVVTDSQGLATVLHPVFRNAHEKTRTLEVSVRFEHPNYTYKSAEHIDVPVNSGAHTIRMSLAASVEIEPTIDGRPARLNDLYAIWSNPNAWETDTAPKKLESGRLRIDGFHPGNNGFMIVQIVEDTITHFSELKQVVLQEGCVERITLPLRPGVRVAGKLSNNVSRPVRDGRVVAFTLPPNPEADRVVWRDWTTVAADGTFAFEAWPENERIQLIALCDGYIATSGTAPMKELEFPGDGYHRPQTFEVSGAEIKVAMTPLVPVTVTITNAKNLPLSGVELAASPNVGWWNYGSQIYANHLVRGKRLIRHGAYKNAMERPFPDLFRGKTDSRGQITLQLPKGQQNIELLSEHYEIPINLGRRVTRLKVEDGKPLQTSIQVQPIGTEKLGEWDKLAGVVYGCSTEEGTRILALPGMHEKVDDFVKRFSDAKNREDPSMLADAYLSLAEAFLGIDEKEEALKWRKKAAQLRKE